MQEEADEALVTRCRNGDGGGFATLVGRYERVIFNLAYRMLGDPDEARDVAQTAFLKALENLHRFDPRFRFYSWLYKIAMNEALDVLKHRGRQTELTDVYVTDDDPALEAQTADLGVRVRGALNALTPDHRAVLVLRHYQDLSYEEIARLLELPDATVKSRLFEARERLRLRLTGEAGVA